MRRNLRLSSLSWSSLLGDGKPPPGGGSGGLASSGDRSTDAKGPSRTDVRSGCGRLPLPGRNGFPLQPPAAGAGCCMQQWRVAADSTRSCRCLAGCRLLHGFCRALPSCTWLQCSSCCAALPPPAAVAVLMLIAVQQLRRVHSPLIETAVNCDFAGVISCQHNAYPKGQVFRNQKSR